MKTSMGSSHNKSILYHLDVLDEQYGVPADLSEYPC